MPGTIIGAFVVDYLGPKWTMIVGLLAQAIVGFIMSGLYESYVYISQDPCALYIEQNFSLTHHLAGFAVSR